MLSKCPPIHTVQTARVAYVSVLFTYADCNMFKDFLCDCSMTYTASDSRVNMLMKCFDCSNIHGARTDVRFLCHPETPLHASERMCVFLWQHTHQFENEWLQDFLPVFQFSVLIIGKTTHSFK